MKINTGKCNLTVRTYEIEIGIRYSRATKKFGLKKFSLISIEFG